MTERAAGRMISVDIGSTWTKGGLFVRKDGALHLERSASTPTTTERLADGFFEVLGRLRAGAGPGTPVRFSSSAKGGLSIAAVGIVPDLTLKMARMTALSAGARVAAVTAYRLTAEDVERIGRPAPDIVLFVGGTDGGNEEILLHNAARLAALPPGPVILYAGNRAAADRVRAALRGHRVETAANVLPELDRPEPEAARGKIREIFLREIVRGKGLEEIVRAVGREPLPTPYAVLELLRRVPEHRPDWGSFCLADLGGATTDFYSVAGPGAGPGGEPPGEANEVRRGLPEPAALRTVEGDLGLRVSAAAAADSAAEWLRARPPREAGLPEADAGFHAWAASAAAEPSRLPRDERARGYERLLAGACLRLALVRHAGTRRRVFTSSGEVWLQRGRDLRRVRRLIGSGGWLGRAADFDPAAAGLLEPEAAGEELRLLPAEVEFYRDERCLIPLLGNLCEEYPKEAVRAALDGLAAAGTAGPPGGLDQESAS